MNPKSCSLVLCALLSCVAVPVIATATCPVETPAVAHAVIPERGRVLAFGSGGHQAFTFTGKRLAREAHGQGYASAQGFSHDDLIIEGAVHHSSPYRLRDPLTTVVVAEWPHTQAHPWQTSGEQIVCIRADQVVIRNDSDATRFVAMQRKQ